MFFEQILNSENLTKYLIITLVAIITNYVFLLIFRKINLVDIPNKRKNHEIPTPYSGGISLLLTLYTSILLFDFTYEINNLIIISTIIFIVGLLDDLGKISIFNRIFLQILSCILIYNLPIKVTDLGYFESLGNVLSLGSFSIIFTIFCIVLTINSFNFFDGIDGNLSILIASSSIISLILLVNTAYEEIIITLLIFSLIFLFFNFSIIKKYKAFLGDSGSNLFGFIFAGLMISSSGSTARIIEPTLIIWVVPIVYFDCLHLVIYRLKNKCSPLMADNNHIHHILRNYTNNSLLVVITLMTVNLILMTTGYFTLKSLGAEWSILLFIFSFIVFFYLKNKFMLK